MRRTMKGMSQEKLGEAIGLTFQQIQKYERGTNRIGASRLYDLSRVLDVPVSFFFDDMPEAVDGKEATVPAEGGSDLPLTGPEADALAKEETLDFIRTYFNINDAILRRRVFEVTKAAAAASRMRIK